MNAPGIPLSAVSSSTTLPPQGPLSFGQVLDRVFRLIRANLGPFIGIGAFPAGIAAVLYLAMLGGMLAIVRPWRPPNPAVIQSKMFGCFFPAMAVLYVLVLLVFALYQAAAVSGALQADAGARITVRGAWGAALRKAGRYIWLAILCGLIVAGPVLLIAAVLIGIFGLAVASGKASSGPEMVLPLIPLLVLLYIGAMVYAVFATLWVSLACPACIAEDLTAGAAIARSFRLVHGAKGRLFLLLLVLYAISYAGMMVVEMVLLFLGSLGALPFLLLHIPLNPWGFAGIGVVGLVFLVAMFLWMAVTWSAYFTSFAVVYRDQRLRKEGAAPGAAIGAPVL